MAGWCPTCRSEWWTEVTACPQCGTELVDELPAKIDGPTAGTSGEVRNHELFEYDLGGVGEAERWQISLLLNADDVAHEWRGSTLRAPEEARAIIETLEPVERVADRPDADRPVDDRPQPASAPRRLGAAFVDFVFVMIVIGAITIAWHTTEVTDGRTIERATTGAYVVSLTLRAAYDIVGVGRWGATFGKRLAGMRVIADDGRPAGWGRSIVRFAVADAGWMVGWLAPGSWSVVTGWLSLGIVIAVYAPIMFDPRRRGLHDRVAGTVVIENPR